MTVPLRQRLAHSTRRPQIARGAPTASAAVCQNGVMDYVPHPMEPLAVQLTVAATFKAQLHRLAVLHNVIL